MTLTNTAHTVWLSRLVDRTADQVDARVLCITDRPGIQNWEWRCNSAQPFDVIANKVDRGAYHTLVVVAPAHALVPEGSHPSIIHHVSGQRLLLAVNRAGECVSMSAHDGHNKPLVKKGGSGPMYAEMVMALVPPGELEAELAGIMTGDNK